MAIRIVRHSEEHREAVLDFNQRMREGGSPWGFYADPQPDWIPEGEGRPVWREYYLAVEDGGAVRGGYALKPQQWWIDGATEWVTDWQGPFSEGAVDSRYTALALRMIRDMIGKRPLLYSVGHGGFDQPMVQLLRKLGWTLHEMPLCLHVRRPYRFLRLNTYLRRSERLRLLQDLLAFTGLGYLGIRGAQLGIRLRHRAFRRSATAVQVAEFGEWADRLWDAHKQRYRCLAVRDRRMMNTLLPASGWPGGTRLKIERGDSVIGWAVVHCKQMSNDDRFGDLRVGLISDCFGAPEDAADIILATRDYLSRHDPDLIFSNQSHPEWVDGFRRSGFLVVEAKRLFAIPPEFRARLEPFEQIVQGLHLTNMDGHGPHGFES